MNKPDRAFHVDEPRFTHSGGLELRRVFVHDGQRGQVTEHVALREPDSLSRLASRRVIDHRQYMAADDWAQDYERAGMSVVVGANYGGPVIVGIEAEPERRRAAKERFRRGYGAMTHPSVVWAVVIEGMSLAAWAHRQHTRRSRATELIQMGLDELADFYGVPA